MLLLPDPKRLMAGYLLGAYITSITVGLVIVFALPGSETESASKHTIGPVEDIVVGLLLWAIAFVLRTERDRPFQDRRRKKKGAKLEGQRAGGEANRNHYRYACWEKAILSSAFVVGILASPASPTSTRSITSTSSTQGPSPPCCW